MLENKHFSNHLKVIKDDTGTKQREKNTFTFKYKMCLCRQGLMFVAITMGGLDNVRLILIYINMART